MKTYLSSLFLFLLFFPPFSNYHLFAQDQDPKIGVALSGGGAKGLVHIGFLKALHEAGIQPDYVTGVSMGSIVGGLYASGYHPDILAQEFRKLDYELLLSDNISEDLVAFDEKPFFRSQLLTFTFKEGKFISPGGLIQGQYITSLMDYYTWPVNTITDFSKLPVPFKALGTNIESVTPRLFDGGNLSDVMRASMAVPLAFTPVEIEDSLYVDGGVTRNFAVEELRDMGADILIGSYSGANQLIDKEKLKSAPNLAAQLMGYNGVYQSIQQFDSLDLLVKYEFGDLSGTSFYEYDSLINLGYQTALKHMDELKAIAAKQGNNQVKRRKVPEFKAIRVDSISVEGNKLHTDKQIIQYLGIAPGYMITPELMYDKMTYMFGLFLFDKINYQVRNEDDKNILIIKCLEKSKNWMNLSLHYDNHYDFGINFDYIYRNALFANSRFSFDAYLSRNFRFKTAFNVPFGKQNRFGISTGMHMCSDRLPSLFSGNNYSQHKRLDFKAHLGFHYSLGNNSKFGLVTEYENVTIDPVVIQNATWDRSVYDNFRLKLQYMVNDLDDYYFATRGKEIKLELRSVNLLSSSRNYSDTEVEDPWNQGGKRLFKDYSLFFRSRYFYPISENFVWSARLNAFLSLDDHEVQNDYVMIGGYDPHSECAFSFLGFHTNEFVVENAIGAGTSLNYRIGTDWNIRTGVDLYMIEDINTKTFHLFYGGGLELGYNSIVGPLKVGVMHGFYDYRQVFNSLKYYFSIGYLIG